MRSKKGQLSQMNILSVGIVAFLIVIFFGGLIYVQGLLKDTFDEVGVINEQTSRQNYSFPCIDNASNMCGGTFYVNMSLASEQIWGQSYQSIQALRMVSAVYILSLLFSIVIVGFLEKKHPFLFFIYILIVLLAVIFAPTISNAYENLLTSNVFGGELANFTTSNWIILNLPIITLVIGILGGIGLFINLIRGGNEESIY
jgi:hypothetical protein